jgi:hypothetical protein
MPDAPETIAQLEESRQTSARLLEQLAKKIGASRSLHGAANVGVGVQRAVRGHPGWWVLVAGFAGFAAASLLRSLGQRSK